MMGAGGFAGGFIVEEGLRRGYEVWAGVRRSTSRKYLSNPEIKFVEFDFEGEDPVDSLVSSVETAMQGGERWDWIIYNLGATKCLRFSDFSRINYDYLRYFIAALKRSGKMPDKLLYLSSLSAAGPVEEDRDRKSVV